MKIGKLENKVLQEIVFKNIKYKRPEVKERSGIGKDCAVIGFGEYDCVMSTDPITAAINEIGRIAINITCNDIATKGVRPIGIMLAVMLPEGTTEAEIEELMKQAGEEAERQQVEIMGGHTEITDAVNKPVIVSTAIGRAISKPENSQTMPKAGDKIVMTKYAGLEGTGIIASDFSSRLKTFLTESELSEAMDTLNQLSVVNEGVLAGEFGATLMHDVTEGGILGAVWEICENADLGCEINFDAIPVLKSTKKICEHFQIDYLKLISSGSLIVIIDSTKEEKLLEIFKENKIEAKTIGELCSSDSVTKKSEVTSCFLIKDGNRLAIMPPESDHIYLVK